MDRGRWAVRMKKLSDGTAPPQSEGQGRNTFPIEERKTNWKTRLNASLDEKEMAIEGGRHDLAYWQEGVLSAGCLKARWTPTRLEE